MVDEVLEAVLRVHEVREDRAPEEFVPECLPEALDLAQRLRMLRPALDVVDPRLPQHLLEFGLATPHRVLTAVVGQDLGRISVRGHAAFESFEHERRLLVVRQRVTDHEAAVVVHEHARVQPLVPAESKREDVRLPQLIRRGALEAPRRVLALLRRRREVHQVLGVQNPTDLRLRNTECLEARQYVADSPSPPVVVVLLSLDHLLFHRVCLRICLQRSQTRTAHLRAL